MPDTQIHPFGTEPAPADYNIPAAAELLLKGAFAKFDGSGAAGAFVPLLRIISDAGSVSLEAPQDVTVAAGGSADATWFPRVAAPAATGAAASPVFARAFNDGLSSDPAQGVNNGQTVPAYFSHTETTDSAVVSFVTTTNTNDTAVLSAVGTYLLYVGAHFDSQNPAITAQITSLAGPANSFPHNPIYNGTNPDVGDGIGSATSQDFAVCRVTSNQAKERVLLNNEAGFHTFAQQVYFTIIYLPTA
jgi:hypothetical protein